MGRLWDIIEGWRDGMEFPPSYRQIAKRMEVSQSTFDTWKAPTEMPRKRSLLTIARVTNTAYHRVVQAAIDDVQLFDEASAEREAQEHRRRRGVSINDELERELLGGDPKSGKSAPVPGAKRRRRNVG